MKENKMKIECPECGKDIETNNIVSKCKNCGAVCVDITKIIFLIIVIASILYIFKRVLTYIL